MLDQWCLFFNVEWFLTRIFWTHKLLWMLKNVNILKLLRTHYIKAVINEINKLKKRKLTKIPIFWFFYIVMYGFLFISSILLYSTNMKRLFYKLVDPFRYTFVKKTQTSNCTQKFVEIYKKKLNLQFFENSRFGWSKLSIGIYYILEN